MSLPVVLILMENFIKVKDAEELGVGRVVRNIVLLITIQKLEKDILMRKTITPLFVVKRRLVSNKKTIALEAIVDIVVSVGIRKLFLSRRNERWSKCWSTLYIQ